MPEEDVNTGEAQTEQSPVETSAEVSMESSTPSAETINTEGQTPEAIPYSRFKEVNDAKKELENKYKEMSDGNAEQSQLIAQLNGFAENPEFAEGFEKLVQQLQVDQQDQQVQPQQEQHNPAVAMVQNMTQQMYLNEFNNLAAEAGFEGETKDEIRKMTTAALVEINAQPLNNYNQGDLKKAFAKVQKTVDGFRRAERASYVQEKQQDEVPSSSTKSGTTSMKQGEAMNSRADRTAYMAEVLRKTS